MSHLKLDDDELESNKLLLANINKYWLHNLHPNFHFVDLNCKDLHNLNNVFCDYFPQEKMRKMWRLQLRVSLLNISITLSIV